MGRRPDLDCGRECPGSQVLESPFPDPISQFWKNGTGTTMATAGAPIGAGARCWGVASSFLGCSVLAAHPADRPAGQRAARAAAAQSPQGEVVVEAPSTPHRVVEVTAVFLGVEAGAVGVAVEVGGIKVIKVSQKRCRAMDGAVEGRVGDIGGGGEVKTTTMDPHHYHLPPVSASAPVGTPCPPNPCAGSCSVMSRARAVTMKR